MVFGPVLRASLSLLDGILETIEASWSLLDGICGILDGRQGGAGSCKQGPSALHGKGRAHCSSLTLPGRGLESRKLSGL